MKMQMTPDERSKNTWYLEGKRIRGVYLQDYEVTGTVTESRVCYGGAIKHTIILDTPITVKFDTNVRTRVTILEHTLECENELLEIFE